MRWWLIALAVWIAWAPLVVALLTLVDRMGKWITRHILPPDRRGQLG